MSFRGQVRQEVYHDRQPLCFHCARAGLWLHADIASTAGCSCSLRHCYGRKFTPLFSTQGFLLTTLGSSRTCCSHRPRRPALRCSWYPLRSLPARLRYRLSPGSDLLPRPRPNHNSRLAQSFLVWSRPSCPPHYLASLPTRNELFPRRQSRKRS